MLSAQGFAATFKYLSMFRDGLICTISLSALTVIFGFVLALILAMIRLSNFNVFRFLSTYTQRKLLQRGGFVLALSRWH